MRAARRSPGPSGQERALERLAERAHSEGLVDVAYAAVDSPLGPIVCAATEHGLVGLSLPHHDPEALLGRLAREVSPRVLEMPARLDRVRRELEEYFEGRRRDFEAPLDRRLTRGFTRRVLEETSRIPFGLTASYAEVAARAGSPRAYRAAGQALGSNPIPIVVPCHRVLASGGGLGGYGGGLDMKRYLLGLEGAAAR